MADEFTNREQLQDAIDAAYDCDNPDLAERLELQLRQLLQPKDAPIVTAAHVTAQREGRVIYAPIRIKSVGYGVLGDSSIADVLVKQGATIHHDQPATTTGFVGTITGGDLREVHYTLNGEPWYMYVLTNAGIDDWEEEWWVSHDHLDAHTAADTILTARKLARSLFHESIRTK